MDPAHDLFIRMLTTLKDRSWEAGLNRNRNRCRNSIPALGDMPITLGSSVAVKLTSSIKEPLLINTGPTAVIPEILPFQSKFANASSLCFFSQAMTQDVKSTLCFPSSPFTVSQPYRFHHNRPQGKAYTISRAARLCQKLEPNSKCRVIVHAIQPKRWAAA